MSKAKVALIGCNFVGMSLGLAIKQALEHVEVIGHDKDREAVRQAESVRAIDRSDWNLPRTCEGAAAIFICAEHDELETTLRAIADDLTPSTLVVAVGVRSVAALEMAQKLLAKDVPFFSTALVYHPDRVSDGSALPAPESIRDAIWAIAPSAGASTAMVDALFALASQLGARPMFIDPLERDGMALAVEVMPAVLSRILMLAVSDDAGWRERMWMAGASFGQAVHSARRAAALADALCAQPKVAVHWLNQVMRQCIALRDAIAQGDSRAITAIFSQAEARHQEWLSNWRKGRTEDHIPIERDHGGLLKLLLGERLAGRLRGNKTR
jgi:prephenate dehydrogenase